MICLIRNLKSISQPINGFDELPLPVETTPGADLARIKWFRNILAHPHKMAAVDFNTAWSNLSDAVSRLGGQPMNQECQELKVKILDQSNHEIMLEIKQSQEKIKELGQTVDVLGTEHSEVTESLRKLQDSHNTLQTEHMEVTELLKDPIPWNIRGQIKEELETWTEDDKMFIETNGAKSVLKCIKENGCVVVTGSSGTGKSSLMRHVSLRMQEEGYVILPVTNPEKIIKWCNPSKKILFVVDDFCGTYTINPMKLESWKNLIEKIKTLIEKKPVKLIMSCRLQVFKDEKMKSLSFDQSCECNLLSEDKHLSETEKQSIAELYLKSNASKVKKFYDMFDCFPLLCQLYSKNKNLIMEDFFKNPFTVYKEEIDKLQTEGAHVKYCALALCVMFNNRLKEEWLTEDVDKDIKTIIRNTYEACKVVKGTSRLVLRDELDSLTHTFIRKDGELYRTIHDKLFDFLAFYFGSVMIYCLIKNASSHFIRERFVFEDKGNRDEFLIVVSERYQQMYISRLVDDWCRGKVVDVFCNINMDNQIFKQRILVHLKGMEILKQKQLASLYDTQNKDTPLIQCCYIGDIDLVAWCLYHCNSNVNHCRKDGISPLFIACQEGHTEVVQMLINNKADINKCRDTGASPLFMACQKGHTEVVQILINNKADINKCKDNDGASPLFMACQEGHTEVVQMLINNKADINKCKDNDGGSPLFMACQKGHTEVVQMLINNKADINKCRDTGSSPLYIACQNGHTEVVQILINNKVDINKCIDNDGASPLFIACENGHTEVVQMLINNKADINKCRDTGASPLFMACQNGHTEVVQMLINNKADINKCRDTGASPLFMACQEGHTEVVQMLINNKADINKCKDNDGASPLFIACENGHTEVVQMLINNKTDINKCKDTGASPLFMACQNGHTEVVQMLINNNADINKCDNDGASPLFIACENGHTEVVQMLINNKTDINKCKDTGASPLFMACENGHTEVVQMLINNKADINKCRDTGASPLFMACQKGHTEVVQMLINNKADINKCTDNDGVSPLYIACQKGHTEVVQILITNKADINKCTGTGLSPIFIACYTGHVKVVELLLKHEADCNIKWRGLTPLDIASRENHTNIVHLLQKIEII
ncbi:ankyrin-3-like [Mytilus edulis]|uniref:ankyrin-3-like n=1 Tax=Mytilus edulis TaxID=6550 RepID=UPI0039F146C4